MATNANDNTKCQHDFAPSLEEAGVDICVWGCGATREAPAGDVDVSAHVVQIVIEQAGRAA